LERGVPASEAVRSGASPLSIAASTGDVALCEALLRRGTSVEAQDRTGQTPLMYAATFARPATVRLLLRNGANPELRDRKGETALTLLERDRPNAIRVNPPKHEEVRLLLRQAVSLTQGPQQRT
jgi:ankyrin repeat protein